MATIVHFDVPAKDIERARKFYGDLFGWKIERLPGPMEYYGITTTASGDAPPVNGGMGKKNEWDTGILNYFGVDSIEESVEKVKELGGQLVLPKTEIPGYGYLAICLDTEGNRFGLWAPLMD